MHWHYIFHRYRFYPLLSNSNISQSSHTLLQNTDNVLPIKEWEGKTIAVLGDDGSANPTIAGGGSGSVRAPYVITPLQGNTHLLINNSKYCAGIQKLVGNATKVLYARTSPIHERAWDLRPRTEWHAAWLSR